MSLLSPETLFKMLGIDPAVVEQVSKSMMSALGELEGMKLGFGNAMSHFDKKLSAIEARLTDIENTLAELAHAIGPQQFDRQREHGGSGRSDAPGHRIIVRGGHGSPDQAGNESGGAAAPGTGRINGHG